MSKAFEKIKAGLYDALEMATSDKGGARSNARLIAELQAVTLATRMFGLDRLPDVMTRDGGDDTAGNEAQRAE